MLVIFKEKVAQYTQKLSELNFKETQALFFLIITLVIAIPVTVVAVRSENSTQTVSYGQTIAVEQMEPEDEQLPDIVAAIEPSKAQAIYSSEAKKVDSLPSLTAQATTTKPNIVMIMLDDTNPIDGRMWLPTRTPNIDKHIVSKGIKFDNFFVETSLCCPGRAGYLTGQHTQNHGAANLDGTKFNPSETFPLELQKTGYFTILTGKYTNNYRNVAWSKVIPPGWTKYNAIYENNGKYYNYRMINKNKVVTSYGSSPADYFTDVVTNIAVANLKQAPADKPIFAYVSAYAAHGPQTSAPRHKSDPRCNNVVWKTPNYNEADISDKPQYLREQPLLQNSAGHNISAACRTYLSVDDQVKRIADELSRQGRLSNTIFILTADNGMAWGAHRLTDKTVPYSTRIPVYISWPSGRGVNARSENTTLSNIDFAPTLCEIAGCVLGQYPNGQTRPDGISFASLLKDLPMSVARDAILESQPTVTQNGNRLNARPYNRPPWWAIRTSFGNPLGLWHYIENDTGEKELYDLSNGPCYSWNNSKGGDPCELNNMLGRNSNPSQATLELASKLSARLAQLKAEKGYNPPTPTPTLTPTPTNTATPTLTPTP